jgi:hypothetical protein
MKTEDWLLVGSLLICLFVLLWGPCKEHLAPQLAAILGTTRDMSLDSHIGPGYYSNYN